MILYKRQSQLSHTFKFINQIIPPYEANDV